MKKSVWIPLGIFLVCAIGAVVWIGPVNILSNLFLLVSEDTEYASGYSESAFRKIKIGDPEGKVWTALGAPLGEREDEPYTRWLYAPDPGLAPVFEANGKYPDMGYSFTTIKFGEDGKFSDAFGQISHGVNKGVLGVSGSASMGDGMNTLSLTEDEIEEFKKKRATPETIESRFGKPDSIYVSRVAKWLNYSRSPGSKNYRQRMIGIDQEGKVCRKRSEIYWD